jgi:nucleoside-triphosphatase
VAKNLAENRVSIALVVGSKNSGKTTYLEHLLRKGKQKNLRTGGFLSRGNFTGTQKKKYFLQDIRSGTQYLLASTTPHPSRTISYGEYYFDQKIFELGNQLLEAQMDGDLIILDEFGPLELRGQGFRRAFDILLQHYTGIILIAVRASLLPEILKLLKPIKN